MNRVKLVRHNRLSDILACGGGGLGNNFKLKFIFISFCFFIEFMCIGLVDVSGRVLQLWWDGLGLCDAVSPAGVTESAKMIYRGYGCICILE